MTYAQRLAAQKKAIEETGKLKVESQDEFSIRQFLAAMEKNKGAYSIHMHVANTTAEIDLLKSRINETP